MKLSDALFQIKSTKDSASTTPIVKAGLLAVDKLENILKNFSEITFQKEKLETNTGNEYISASDKEKLNKIPQEDIEDLFATIIFIYSCIDLEMKTVQKRTVASSFELLVPTLRALPLNGLDFV